MRPVQKIVAAARYVCGCGKHRTREEHNKAAEELNKAAAEKYMKTWKPFTDWCPASAGGWTGD